ncbi:hypothetical protein FACS1894132_13370 [Clostridia bacterium]|nr:hypothetical protein FACS1894132_13370 [Clostridia bacterium]
MKYEVSREEYYGILGKRQQNAYGDLISELFNWILQRNIKIEEVPFSVRVQNTTLYIASMRTYRVKHWAEYFELLKLIYDDFDLSLEEYKPKIAEQLRQAILFCEYKEEQEFEDFRGQVEEKIFRTCTHRNFHCLSQAHNMCP